ncbi:MAG: CPBP family intramembrane glutamic endopeptidase [Chloroflexota bacterium]
MLILLLLLILGIVIMANLMTREKNLPAGRYFAIALSFFNLTFVAIGLLLVLELAEPFLQTADLSDLLFAPRPAGLVILLVGIWGVVVSQTAVRQWLSRYSKIDPDSTVHLLALLAAGYLIGATALTLVQGGVERLTETAVAVGVVDVITQQFFFAMLALFGVGLLTRRSNEGLNERLGLVPLSQVSVKTAVRWIALLVLLQWIVGATWFFANPEQAESLSALSGELFAEFDTVWEWFALAVASGVGEELLFRGALQPIFGLWPTSLLFAVAHVQYGITPATFAILLVGLALGVIRQRTNTTTAICVHFGYNFTLGMLALLALYLEPLVG